MVAWLEEPGCFLKAKRLLLEGQKVLLLLHCRCGMGRAVLWPGPSVLLPALLCLSVLQLYLHIGLSFGVCCCRCRLVRWRMLCRYCCLGGCLATSSLRSPRSFSCRACDGPHYGCFAVMVLFPADAWPPWSFLVRMLCRCCRAGSLGFLGGCWLSRLHYTLGYQCVFVFL